MSTNDSLAARARAGDAEAFAELYRQVYQDLYRFALYTLKKSPRMRRTRWGTRWRTPLLP